MIDNRLADKLAVLCGADNIRLTEPLAAYTSMQVGGPCDALVTPPDLEKLQAAYRTCREQGVPVFILGKGSNLVVRDGGIEGVVLYTYPYLQRIIRKDTVLEAECGLLLKDLADYARDAGLGGLEFASGIPGTLGGAVIMNAGAYGGEMKDVVMHTWYLTPQGEISELEGTEHDFAYRYSRISQEKGIVLKSRLQLYPQDAESVTRKMAELNQMRADKQPLEMPSAGSVFKRPTGYYTGQLIQECGLKGFSIGGAQVSEKHSGFIVNTGTATAEDIIRLIAHIQKTVQERFGVELETEVRIVGRPA